MLCLPTWLLIFNFHSLFIAAGMLVALKKISANDDLNGFSFSTLQELNFLRRCEHSNVARLLEVIQDNNEEAESKRITGG